MSMPEFITIFISPDVAGKLPSRSAPVDRD
jgi:hypothetical protein